MGFMDKITGRAKQMLGDLSERRHQRQEAHKGHAKGRSGTQEGMEEKARRAADPERRT